MGHTFTALSFRSGRTKLPDVPESGDLWVKMRLVQGDRVVAQGYKTWNLRPRTEWHLIVTRGLVPEYHSNSKSVSLDDLDQPSCQWLGCFCSGVARMRIEDWAANFPEEALWLHWYSLPTEFPDDVIFC